MDKFVKRLAALLAMLVTAGNALALVNDGVRHDDYFMGTSSVYTCTFDYNRIWRGAEWPHDGGVMTGAAAVGPLSGDAAATGDWEGNGIHQNVVDLRMGGINFDRMTARLYGEDITFVGQDPFVSAAAHDPYSSFLWPWIDLTLRGLGDKPLVKKSQGPIFMNRQPVNFSYFEIADGTLVLTNDTIDFSSAVPLHLTTGKLLVTPTDGKTNSLSGLVARDGHGVLAVTNNATLDISELKRQSGGVLEVQTSNGGKVFARNLATGTTKKAVDGGLISLSGNVIKFLSNTAADGLVPGSGTPANACVKGSVSDKGGSADTSPTLKSAYEYLYRPALNSGTRTLKLTKKIPNAKGLTVASPHTTGERIPVDLTEFPSSDYELRLLGVDTTEIAIPSTKYYKFLANANATLTVLGAPGARPTDNGRIVIGYSDEDSEIGCKLRLGGGGVNGNDALRYYNKLDYDKTDIGRLILNGAVELLNDTAIQSPSNATVVINAPITGHGGLRFAGGRMRLTNLNNDFDGTFTIANSEAMDSWVFVSDGGRLGSNDLDLGTDAKLIFSDDGNCVLANRFTGNSGDLYVQNSSVEFKQPTAVEDIRVGNAHTQDVAVVLHRDFQANYALAEESYGQPGEKKVTISAAENDVAFTVGDESGQNSFLGGDLEDGADGGKLSIVKRGNDSVLIIGGTNNTYTGQTRILGGTLRLGASLFSKYDSSLWLDASAASTITAGTNNRVTKWTDMYGRYYFTGEGNVTTKGMGCSPRLAVSNSPSAYMNNRKFVNFTYNKNGAYERLVPGPDDKLQIRTMFICCHGCSGASTREGAALIQYNETGCHLHVDKDGSFPIYTATTWDYYNRWLSGLEFGYENGESKSSLSTKADAGATVVNFFNLRAVANYCNSYEHVDEFRPWIGGVANCWDGDIGEIIAFPRMLNQAECNEVLNYLLKKWNPSLYATKGKPDSEVARSRVNFLPTATDVEIGALGILDLNGATQTVARISGTGVITNSADGVAVLTVTDASEFKGTITGNIIVTLPTADAELRVRNGAELVMSGAGEAVVGVSNPEPPKHSLQCWIDASYKDTMELRSTSSGLIKKWSCRPDVTCAGSFFYDINASNNSPKYDANGICANKPAAYFNKNTNLLRLRNSKSKDVTVANGYGRVATVFYVTRIVAPNLGTYKAFALSTIEQGLQIVGETSGSRWNIGDVSGLCNYGDTVHINGLDISEHFKTNSSYWVSGTSPIVFAARFSESHLTGDNVDNLSGPIAIGNYCGSKQGCAQYVAEVICYTNRLTDAEFAATERYLMDKWVTSGTSWPTAETQAIASDCSVGVKNGATMDLSSAEISVKTLIGDGLGGGIKASKLTVNNKIVIYPVGEYGMMRIKPISITGEFAIGNSTTVEIVNYEGLEKYYRHEVMSVNGTVSGSNQLPQSKTNITAERWKWLFTGTAWCIVFDNSIGITIW